MIWASLEDVPTCRVLYRGPRRIHDKPSEWNSLVDESQRATIALLVPCFPFGHYAYNQSREYLRY